MDTINLKMAADIRLYPP